MISIRSSLILVLMLSMSVNAADSRNNRRSRRYALAPFFSSMQFSTPTAVKPTAFDFRRTCILILRGGDTGHEDDSDTNHDKASRRDILSDRLESKDDSKTLEKKEGDVWEEVIRNTREYYSNASQSSKSSSSSVAEAAASTLIASPNNVHASPTTTTSTVAATSISRATTTAPSSTINGSEEGEDERVFGVSHAVCDNSLRNSGEVKDDSGDGEKYLTSETLIRQEERSDDSMDDGVLSNIHDESDKLVMEDFEVEFEMEKIREDDAAFSCENDEEIDYQEILASDGSIPCQVESDAYLIQDRIDEDYITEGIVTHGGVPEPPVLETSVLAEKQGIVMGGSVGTQVNKDVAADDNGIGEEQKLGTYSETLVTALNNNVLVIDDETDGCTTNGKTQSQEEFPDRNHGIDVVQAKSANRGVVSQLVRKVQRRISSLMMLGGRKELRRAIISLVVALSLLLNSFSVKKELHSNNDGLPYSIHELANIEEDEDSLDSQ